jgi:hypothetical protein
MPDGLSQAHAARVSAGALTAAPPAASLTVVPWTGMVAGVAVLRLVLSVVAVCVGLAEGLQGRRPVLLGLVVVFGVAGAVLLTLGQRDRRAVSLGVFFLLAGTSFTVPFWEDLAERVPAAEAALRIGLSVRVETFLPFYLWLFVRDFPRVRRVEARALRRTLRGVLAVCSLFFGANLALGFRVTGPDRCWSGGSRGLPRTVGSGRSACS